MLLRQPPTELGLVDAHRLREPREGDAAGVLLLWLRCRLLLRRGGGWFGGGGALACGLFLLLTQNIIGFRAIMVSVRMTRSTARHHIIQHHRRPLSAPQRHRGHLPAFLHLFLLLLLQLAALALRLLLPVPELEVARDQRQILLRLFGA